MGAAEKKDEEQSERLIEVPLERFDRLLRLLERVAQFQERQLARQEDAVRRAARKIGPTTEAARADVKARHKKWKEKGE